MTSIANINWSLEMAASALDKHAVSDHFSRAAHSYDEHAILQLAVGRSLVQRLPQRLIQPQAPQRLALQRLIQPQAPQRLALQQAPPHLLRTLVQTRVRLSTWTATT